MSDEIALSHLTTEDLKVLNNISVMDPLGHTMRVWESRRLTPFSEPFRCSPPDEVE